MKPKNALDVSRTSPLAFTFVPVSGILPTQVTLGKDINFLPKIARSKEEMAQKPTIYREQFSEERIKENNRSSLGSLKSLCTEHVFAGKEVFTGNIEERQQNELFIAEFVLVMDSDEDKDDTKDKNNRSICTPDRSEDESRVKQLQRTPEPERTIPFITINQIYVPNVQREDGSQDIDFQEKEQQLFSSVPLTSPSQCTQQYTDKIHSIQHTLHNSNVNLPQKHQQLTCSPPVNIRKQHFVERSSPTSNKYMFSKELISQGLGAPIDTQLQRTHDTQSIKMKYSNYSNIHENQTQHSPILPRNSYESINIMSPLPIRVFKHDLCPSPSPLQSPMYGSSSTLCSTSMSPTPSCETSSRVPSRLSFLTSLLRSNNSSQKRPYTPEISHYNLISKQSQALSVLQKSGSPLMETRKSLSCFSLHSPYDLKTPQIITQSDMLPSASESNILQPQFSLYRQPMRTLSPDSAYFKTSSSGVTQNKYASSHLSNQENVPTLNVKPPLNKYFYKPLKKYSVLGKNRKVTVSPPVSPSKESPSNFINVKQTVLPTTKMHSATGHFRPRDNIIQGYVGHHSSEMPSTSVYVAKRHDFSQPGFETYHKLSNEDLDSELAIHTQTHLHPNSHSNIFNAEELPGNPEQIFPRSDNAPSPSRSSLSRCSDFSSTHSLSPCSELDHSKTYKIKSSYKAFAAIPTNTLLRDQKAIDEPETSKANSAYDNTLEPRSKMCSPAQLRKETEEICAEIDKVLHDPLPLHTASAGRSPKMTTTVRTQKPKPQLKSPGRETKYASLQTKAATNKSSSGITDTRNVI
uniref:Muscular LMNA-interacting protein n=1 Tax=Leptobrachium leishanense TaxID=445787 RepID=A0A8C5MB01_9ANUR